MAKLKKERAEKYEPKIKLKEGVEFVDIINASLGLAKTKKPAKKSAGKKG
ncbi:MAG: hypothetical protein JST90_16860 [Bacteroidetes bacterium]|nr:hypothetical protein [Bacteroidota bacterium]